MRIVLASASPRRKELIAGIDGIEVEIIASDCEEQTAFTTVGGYVCALARLKAENVYEKTGKPTVGADTVVFSGEVLGKPHGEDHAKEMLRALSGKAHEVVTGVCLIKDGRVCCRYESTTVKFKPFTEQFIEEYVKSGSPLDKAGAYGLQDEMLAPFVDEVQGCKTNVIGLPVPLLGAMIEESYKWQK